MRLHLIRHALPSIVACAAVVGWPAWGEAQPQRRAFVEATGGWGYQLGETEYLPDGSPGAYKHPVVTGYAVGGTAGVFVAEDLALIVAYAYDSASSRTGDIPMVIDEVEGEIAYHTIAAGVRLSRRAGPGRLRVEFALGVVLPYETQLEIEYGPALAALPEPITGTGVRNQHFTIGFGGHGAIGYELPLGGQFYVAGGLKLETFQANNEGEETRLDNFVTDFEAEVPAATTAVIEHGDGGAPPESNSVQDVRAQLSIGVAF